MFGTIVICKQQNKNPHRLKALERYDILYKEDFNPNAEDLILFRDGVQKDHIGTYLVSLCKEFYERAGSGTISESFEEAQEDAAGTEQSSRTIHQCGHCYTVYDETIGEASQNVVAGTLFEDLPPSFYCPLCEAPKNEFMAVEETSLASV
jgi:rubredoxin